MTNHRAYALSCLILVPAVALLCHCQAVRLAYSGDRSGQWQGARALHLSIEPQCAACGTTDRLEVHHVTPFAENPALELEQTNMITLCRLHGSGCHWRLGHGGANWRDGWPDVRRELGGVSNSIGYKVRRWREGR